MFADGLFDEGSDSSESECNNSDAGLSPVEKLDKYVDSEHSYNRYVGWLAVSVTAAHLMCHMV